ncbi:Anoctamin-like protein, partial [Globisporangium splendens]
MRSRLSPTRHCLKQTQGTEPRILHTRPIKIVVTPLNLDILAFSKERARAQATAKKKEMAALADAVLKGGVGTIGFVASAITLTKFIVSTHVKIGERGDAERDMDLILCFDAKTFDKSAVDFFVTMVQRQSHLLIAPKPRSIVASSEEADGSELYYLVGADYNTLTAIKEKKEKLERATLVTDSGTHKFDSGERIDLLVYELSHIGVSSINTGGETSEIPKPFEAEEHGLLLQQALYSRLLTDYFPLHDDQERDALMNTWVKKWKDRQPINNVRAYFGDEIGFYFAFLGTYSRWLVAPAAIGVIVFILEFFSTWSIYGRALYSLMVTSWATAFLKFWKRRESALRNEWAIAPVDSVGLDPARPDFWGEKRFDVVEGTYYTFFPSIKRVQRYLLTYVVTLAVLAVIMKLMFIYFHIENWFGATFTEEKGWDGMYQYVSLAPSVAYSVVVLILDAKYSELANYLTKFENHRTDSDFANALVLKLASFYFVNNFGSLFYLAFRSRDMDLLEQTLSSLLITRQLIGNVKEQLIPYMTAKSSLKTTAGKIAKETHEAAPVMSKVEAELLFPSYDGTFDDYLELFVQFGLANNVMEIRSDAFKLCMSYRRSRRPTSHGIGTWLYAFNALGYLSVMTNCAIFGLHSGLMDKLFPDLSFAGLLLGVAIMEHVMIAVKVSIEMLVPDVPSSVLESQRIQRATLRKKATLQVELSSRRLLMDKSANVTTDDPLDEIIEVDGVPITKESVKEWMKQEHERRTKLELEVKSLNELYMGWIREEQAKRKDAERKLAELQQNG